MAKSPDVSFLVNHKGVTMARTKNGSLQLSKDSHGLHVHAFLNADRQDVRDLAYDVIRHRLVLSYEALSDGQTADRIIMSILKAIPAPDKPLATHLQVPQS